MFESIAFFKVESMADDNQVNQFDFNKIILFCLLFSNEGPRNKVDCLFYLMCDDSSTYRSSSYRNNDHVISSRSEKTKTIIAMLTIIACMIPVEYIKLDPLEGARRNY